MAKTQELVTTSIERHPGDDAESCTFVLHVPADYAAFEGHFAASPILPAYAQLREVIRRIHEIWPSIGAWQAAPKVKFQAPIPPDVAIELSLRRAVGRPQVTFTIVTADTLCASGTLVFA